MARGRFITLEGGEGVGKSTQVQRLAEALRARGLSVVTTREPGGSEGAEAIRALLLNGDPGRWSPRAEALLFAAARADHVEKTILPALQEGSWVLCDRYFDSSAAYQGQGSGVTEDELGTLHHIGAGLMPDRTLVLSLRISDASSREFVRDGGQLDRFGSRDSAFHERVHGYFEALAERAPDRVRKVAADGTQAEVTERLLGALADYL
ncbi:dTMP kinase [Sphingomonas sp. ID0503]|uniref:dTMP kinase n=1 Tax=Sphingomonas sp. ID0503 TaxID=3399691 RepID=UPI003AFA819E